MRVYSSNPNVTYELGKLVELAPCPGRYDDSIFRSEFYMNNDGDIVWEMYNETSSLPLSTIIYKVSLENAKE